mmetsp:Transcript_6770/g.25304  ORF Transcript_6770/g.25304 Transcript_6770/m.25304 type:complete len:149 (-) Transcript_6770:1115-1561(-)
MIKTLRVTQHLTMEGGTTDAVIELNHSAGTKFTIMNRYSASPDNTFEISDGTNGFVAYYPSSENLYLGTGSGPVSISSGNLRLWGSDNQFSYSSNIINYHAKGEHVFRIDGTAAMNVQSDSINTYSGFPIVAGGGIDCTGSMTTSGSL